MDKETILYLISLVSICIAIAGFYFGRKKQHVDDTTREAEWKGGINAKLDQLIMTTSVLPSLTKQVTEAVESSKSAHKRIDRIEDKLK